MTMEHLLRELAPISDRGWHAIESEAEQSLRHFLVARRLVDVVGPQGWEKEVARRGSVDEVPDAPIGVQARVRTVQPLVELRSEFWAQRSELDAVDRGSRDADFGPARDAARRLALAEDAAAFNVNKTALISGIAEATPHPRLRLGENYAAYPSIVASAVDVLQTAGISGPYAVALGPRCYTGVVETTEMGGYPVLEHLRLIAGGSVLWAPSIDGAIVISQRGGDFLLTLGEDASIGYLDHDADRVHLYVEESFTFQVLTDDAAVHLSYT